MLALAVAAGLEVEAVHVDHGQRAASEAELVAGVAAELGASFRSERVQVEPGSNLEARMRAARYAVLGSHAATGHTADDQAETMLINLMRGAGLPGLGAMQPGVRRPILDLRRADTEAICQKLGFAPFHDPSNTEARFVRNRVRHELMPLLNDIADRDVVPLFTRTSQHVREAVAIVDDLAAELDPTDAKQIAAANPQVAGVALRCWLQEQTRSEYPVDAASIERVLAVAAGNSLAAEVTGGHRVSRSNQRLRVDGPR